MKVKYGRQLISIVLVIALIIMSIPYSAIAKTDSISSDKIEFSAKLNKEITSITTPNVLKAKSLKEGHEISNITCSFNPLVNSDLINGTVSMTVNDKNVTATVAVKIKRILF